MHDVLVFTWDIRSLEGRDTIASYLANTLSTARVTDVRSNKTEYFTLGPVLIPATPDVDVELAFAFECKHGHARAHVRLLHDPNGTYKALTLLTELEDLAGYEEALTMPLHAGRI